MEYNVNGLNKLSKQLNEFVKKVGFDNNDIPLRIALIHSEISEAFESFRKDKTLSDLNDKSPFFMDSIFILKDNEVFKENFEKQIKDTMEDEIADSIIRLLDLCGKLDIDIEKHIQMKMRYNGLRGFKYGGKKF